MKLPITVSGPSARLIIEKGALPLLIPEIFKDEIKFSRIVSGRTGLVEATTRPPPFVTAIGVSACTVMTG